jgi:succinyl-CoA synthetase beta subunit
MAQISIREYDVKKMFYKNIGKEYSGIQIREISDIEELEDWKKYVIKPDMLFWKRGKRGLLGINLNKTECKDWLKKYFQKQENIDGVEGALDVFLVEEIVTISDEYYLSFSQSREGDIITFSPDGGIDIEENWDSTKNIIVPVTEEFSDNLIEQLIWTELFKNTKLVELITELWKYYRTFGFVSLELNPIAKDIEWIFHMIDAVAKVDDQEEYIQKSHWKDLEIPNNYGFQENAGERYIKQLDSQTWASLKMKILNSDAQIWTLFAWGGWSLVMTDTLWALWYADNIWNYWECSGNPTREFTYEYTKTLLSEMLRNQVIWKYLIIAWAIANFTHIDTTFSGIIDALEEKREEIHNQKVIILVRRGGINEKAGLKILEDACKRLKIPAIITGSDIYMTEILQEIKI